MIGERRPWLAGGKCGDGLLRLDAIRSSRTRQLSALLPSRSKIPASYAESAAFPLRKSRPEQSTRRFGNLSDPGGHRFQIDVRTNGQEGYVSNSSITAARCGKEFSQGISVSNVSPHWRR